MFQKQQWAQGRQRKRTVLNPRKAHTLSTSFSMVESQIFHLKNKVYTPTIPVNTQE